jgi:hypothetical protein
LQTSLSNHALFSTNCVLLVLIGAIFTLVACGKGEDESAVDAGGGVSFRTIDSGTRPASGSNEHAQGQVLCSERAAKAAFASWRLPMPTPSAAVADFSRSCVIAVLAGGRPGGGFRLRFDRIAIRSGRAIATVTIRRPPGVIDAATISRPYAVAEVPSQAVMHVSGNVLIRETAASE